MNRHERRAAAVKGRSSKDAEAIRQVYFYLANMAAPSATGATVFLPDGTTVYVSVEDARAFYGDRSDEVLV